MKKFLVLLLCSIMIVGCSTAQKVESTPRLEKEAIKNIINNIEEKGDFLDCSKSMGIFMGYGGTFTFAITEDDIFFFFNQEIMVFPDKGYFTTKNAKCVYDYNDDNVLKNTECTNEDIELGGKVLDFMENKLSEFDTDINSIKEVVIYVRDNKYSTSLPQENETDTNKDIQSNTTLGQKNALKSAYDYLKYSSFSYKGLVEQLEFEGYTTDEATYAVDNCGADWKKQAEKTAQSYLDSSSFSRQGLIDQLIFEGFTKEEAEHGVSAAGY